MLMVMNVTELPVVVDVTILTCFFLKNQDNKSTYGAKKVKNFLINNG